MVGEARDAATPAGRFPERRVVLLGASNLTRGIATVVETARSLWGRPLDVLAALGHGRSYGMRSTVLGRTLPSTLDCGLWDALARRPAAPTAALVTDIGNDLLYEAPVERIVDWVGQCLDRLLAKGARVAISRLPVANIAALSELRFRLLRRVMFPLGRLDFATISARAFDLDRRIVELARARDVGLVEQQTLWYGWDPIHIRRRFWPSAWRQMLAPWTAAEPTTEATAQSAVEPSRASFLDELYLRLLAPQERRWLGIVQRCPQPCGRLRDGTMISYY
jgi:hypothetical protein